MSKRNRQNVTGPKDEAAGQVVDMGGGVLAAGNINPKPDDKSEKPKPMTTQECWHDAEFPAAFLAATAVVYGTGRNGDGENGWVASMAMGELCAEHFVRRLREGKAGVQG